MLSVLLAWGTGVSEENYWPDTSHWQTLPHSVVSSTPHHRPDTGHWQTLPHTVVSSTPYHRPDTGH
jgi:hypothetical protein